jgi:hypothetical protein
MRRARFGFAVPARLLGALVVFTWSACTADGCVRDVRDPQAARSDARPRQASGLVAQSWGVCSLIGPRNPNPGIWGTDLGFGARGAHDSQLTLLFGDTWARPNDACQVPVTPNDDFQASLPVQRPALLKPGPPAWSGGAARACNLLSYPYERPDDVLSWRRIRVFPNTVARSADSMLDMSGLRTPVAAFSDGARLFGIFARNDPTFCDSTAECPAAMRCSSDPDYHGRWLGTCKPGFALTADAAPSYCRSADDCPPANACAQAARGVCVAAKPFEVDTQRGGVAPTWYADDPRRGLAQTLYVAVALWPDHPSDYGIVARFATNRFQNPAARSVAFFDPAHPERNDYRPGYHTLLVWGRSTFAANGGAQALPFLLYVNLSELRGDPSTLRWQPHFFAGYGRDGAVRWSDVEADARPIYGDDARLVAAPEPKLQWPEPEFDVVDQMSVSWVAPLRRWVMLYGGDAPAFIVLDPHTGATRKPVNLPWAPGAVHMRAAAHPWGAAHRGDREEAWSSAEPALTRTMAAPYLACGDEGPKGNPGCVEHSDTQSPLAVIGALAETAVDSPKQLASAAGSCMSGALVKAAQDRLSGDLIGRLYAPNILDDWTEDVSERGAAAGGERKVELYWNASTWNPYQVVLFKTLLTGRPLAAAGAR